MSPCCPTQARKQEKTICPDCGNAGRSVSPTTLHHQVRFPDNLAIAEADFHFCASSDCDVAYFSTGGTTILKNQLREKAHFEAGWLCYCFDISKADYQYALDNNTAGDIKHFVIEQTKTGTCACTTRNPSGQCCLADFKRFEKEYVSE